MSEMDEDVHILVSLYPASAHSWVHEVRGMAKGKAKAMSLGRALSGCT